MNNEDIGFQETENSIKEVSEDLGKDEDVGEANMLGDEIKD